MDDFDQNTALLSDTMWEGRPLIVLKTPNVHCVLYAVFHLCYTQVLRVSSTVFAW